MLFHIESLNKSPVIKNDYFCIINKIAVKFNCIALRWRRGAKFSYDLITFSFNQTRCSILVVYKRKTTNHII